MVPKRWQDRNGHSRCDREWIPDIDDNNDYVWRNGYWEIHDWELERNESDYIS